MLGLLAGAFAVLGMAWAVIMPLVMVGTFVFLNRTGVISIGQTDIPYIAFALLGLSIWQLFATGLTACTNSIVQGGTMVIKINFPKESLVIAALAQSVFEFLVRVGLLAVVFTIYKIMPSVMTLLLPLTLIPLMLLAGDKIKLFSHGSLDMVKQRQPVCGLKISQNLFQQKLLMVENKDCINYHHQKIEVN